MRELTLEDFPEVIRIERETFDEPWPLAAFDGMFNHPNFGVQLGNQLIGFILYNKVLDEAVITNFAVLKDHRGKGHGEYLLEQSMKTLRDRGCSRFYLEVRQSNQVAISLYHKYGYQSLGIRKGYYNAPTEDAVVMGAFFTSTSKEDDDDL